MKSSSKQQMAVYRSYTSYSVADPHIIGTRWYNIWNAAVSSEPLFFLNKKYFES